jgi:tetratricopeptide (TPR) repeat protein
MIYIIWLNRAERENQQATRRSTDSFSHGHPRIWNSRKAVFPCSGASGVRLRSKLIQRSRNSYRLVLVQAILGLCFGISSARSASHSAAKFESLLRGGFELHRQQQYNRSIPLLEQAHSLRPEDYQVNLLLGIDYLRSGDPRKALSFLAVARDTRPGDATALGYLAEGYATLNKFDRAVESLQSAACKADEPAESRLALVQFYLRRFVLIEGELRSTTAGSAYAYRLQALILHARQDPKEREALLRVQALVPHFPGLESALGHEDLLRSRFERAEAEFSQARSINPNDLDMMVGEAILAVRSGDLRKAEVTLSEVANRSRARLLTALREWPASVGLPVDLKRRLLQVRKPERASATLPVPRELHQEQRWESLVRVLASKSLNPEESFWLGSSLAHLGRFDEAIPPLERARHETRLALEANYWLSFCYARGAEEGTRQFQKAGKESALAHVVRAEVLLRLVRDGAAATAEYQRAVSALPGDPSVWTGLAASQLLAGDSQGARDSARKALQLDPRRTPAARTYAESSIQERDYAAAIPPLRQVLGAQPNDTGAQVLLATAYSKTGDDPLALRFLEAALSQGYPDEKGSVHYLLGTVLRRLGREKEAGQAFEQAQALSDSFAQSSHGATGTAQ